MPPRWTDAQTLLLHVPRRAWPPPARALRLDGIAFQPKPELHVTVAGRALGARLQAACAASDALAAGVQALRARLDWRWTRRHRWWRLADVRAGLARGSVVETIALPAMAAFHAGLGGLLGEALPVPPPHVTLWTAEDSDGIGVPDPATWERCVVREVAAAELPG